MISCWTIFKNCYHINPLLFLWLQGIEKLHSIISNSVISGLNFLWNPWASTIWSWHLVTLFVTLLYKLLCWQFKQRQIFQWVLFSIKRKCGTGNLFGLLDSSMGNRNAHKSSNFLLMASSSNISFTSSSTGPPKSSTFLVSDELGIFFFFFAISMMFLRVSLAGPCIFHLTCQSSRSYLLFWSTSRLKLSERLYSYF